MAKTSEVSKSAVNASAAEFTVEESTATADSLDFVRRLSGESISITSRDLTAQIIADCIIDFCHEHGDLISNLKLQILKMLSTK